MAASFAYPLALTSFSTTSWDANLDALRDTLRAKNYSPVIFDFEKPATRNLTETIRVLVGMAHFVIADITEPESIPQELMAIVPNLASVPRQPLLLASQQENGIFEYFRSYPWVSRSRPTRSPSQLGQQGSVVGDCASRTLVGEATPTA